MCCQCHSMAPCNVGPSGVSGLYLTHAAGNVTIKRFKSTDPHRHKLRCKDVLLSLCLKDEIVSWGMRAVWDNANVDKKTGLARLLPLIDIHLPRSTEFQPGKVIVCLQEAALFLALLPKAEQGLERLIGDLAVDLHLMDPEGENHTPIDARYVIV